LPTPRAHLLPLVLPQVIVAFANEAISVRSYLTVVTIDAAAALIASVSLIATAIEWCSC